MKKLIAVVALFALTILTLPIESFAAGGIYASGGGTKTVGQTFTISVSASGATFDTFEGTVSVTGPVSVSSFSYGDATYIGAKPSDGVHFVGTFLGDKKTSFSVATIKLKATGVGSGAVSVKSVALKSAGSVVGTGAGSASFTIQKAPELPGAVTVASSSHPDQNTAYEATTIALSWNKEAGVDNFSYLLDQAETTVPAAKATDANTTVSYPDKATGIYYFHIRAHKPDGWGTTTHFKINIKEPDAKIDETLSAPSDIQIKKLDEYINSITDGTFSGIVISGTTEPGFTANLTLIPAPIIPDGKKLSALAGENGKFEIVLDYPIVTGFHTFTIQGQKEKVLTPTSELIAFEISQAKGGTISILTKSDEFAPVITKVETPKKWYQKLFSSRNIAYYIGLAIIILLILAFAATRILKNKKAKKLLKNLSKQMTDNR